MIHGVTCVEAHNSNNECKSGEEMNLYHFYMALKLSKSGRWLQVRNYLDEKFGIQVNFSDNYKLIHTTQPTGMSLRKIAKRHTAQDILTCLMRFHGPKLP